MNNLRQKAAEVAKAGRYGDTQLIHVAPEELAGLASLMPGGKLTTNPKTGLPEAFFFLPFLAGLGSLGAGAAAAGTAAASGALGAGLGAGMTAAALPLAATTAGTTAGALGGAAGLGAASALPLAGTAAATSALPTAAGTAASILPSAAIPTSLGGVALPEVAGAATSALPAASAASPFILEGALPAATTAGTTGGIGISGGATAGAGAGSAASSALPATGASTASTLGGAIPTGAAGVGAGAEAAGTLAVPQAAGGILGGLSADKLLQYGALASMMMPMGGGGDDDEGGGEVSGDSYERGDAEFPEGDEGRNSEWDFFPRSRYFSGGGLVKGYAEGGLASLDKKSGGDEELIEATMMALMGQTPNADAIIQQFIATFGKEALQDLIGRLQASSQMMGGGQPQGDGMSDSVPAMIVGEGGTQPAALSEGEYVVPADVVSGLGNGSTEAGAQQLQGMVDRTRMMRTGGIVQPPAMNPRGVMPR